MLQPKKTKYRKMQKGRMKGNAQRGHEIAFGSFALKTVETTFLTGVRSKQPVRPLPVS